MKVVPLQDTYLAPFCDDSPTGLGKWIQIYNLFVRRGNETLVGQNTTRFADSNDITGVMPAVSGRVYDQLGNDFSGTWSSGSPNTVTLNGGIVVINNTVIELQGFTTIFNELASHWAPGNIYGTWSFTQSATSTAVMCVLFDPYNTDGSVNSTQPAAKIIYARMSEIDYSIMAPLWLVKVTKSGSTVTNAQLLLETSGVDLKIEQIGYWKNFIVDGGNFV